MKEKISVSIDEGTLGLIREGIAQGRFRNISHALEYGVRRLLK